MPLTFVDSHDYNNIFLFSLTNYDSIRDTKHVLLPKVCKKSGDLNIDPIYLNILLKAKYRNIISNNHSFLNEC